MQADPLPRSIGRVVLRRLAPADLSRFQAYRHDPDVSRYQGWEPQPDHEATRFIQEMCQVDLFPRGAWFQLGIAVGSTNESWDADHGDRAHDLPWGAMRRTRLDDPESGPGTRAGAVEWEEARRRIDTMDRDRVDHLHKRA